MKKVLSSIIFTAALLLSITAFAADGEWFFRNNINNSARLIDIHMLGAHDAFTASLNSNSEVDAAGVKLGDEGSKGARTSWSTNVINASKAQSADVEAMLNRGVRYFDVRLSRYKDDGEFYTVHGRISDKFTGEGGIARKISEWAKAHPGELIVLDFQSLFDIQTDNGGASQQSWRDLMAKLTEDGITKYVYTRDGSIEGLTYGGLTNDGARPAIVLFGQVTGAWADSRFINRRDDDGYMRSYHTGTESYSNLRSALAQEYAELMDANREKYYYRFRVMQAQTTPGVLSILFGRGNLINDANENNIKILTDPDYDKWCRLMPVLMVDNATSDSGDFNALAVEKLAKMNREYTPGVYRAESGDVFLTGSNDNVPLGAAFTAALDGEALTLSLSEGGLSGEMTVVIRSHGKKQQLYKGETLLGETGGDGLLRATVSELGTFTLIETDEDIAFTASLPLLWYNFMEGGDDNSGNALDAAMEGSPVLGGGAARLTPGNVLRLPSGLSKHMESYTVSAWVKLNAPGSNTRFFDIGRRPQASIFGDAGTDKTASGMKNSTTIRAQGSGLTVGQWAHIAAEYSNGTLTLYINGQLAATNTTGDPSPNMINDYFNPNGNYIGRTMWYAFGTNAGDNPDINADIADFRIYDAALSAEEIGRLARTPRAVFIDIETGEEFREAEPLDVPAAYSGYTFPEAIGEYVLVESTNVTDMAGNSDTIGYYRGPEKKPEPDPDPDDPDPDDPDPDDPEPEDGLTLNREGTSAEAEARISDIGEVMRLYIAVYEGDKLIRLDAVTVTETVTTLLVNDVPEEYTVRAFLWRDGIVPVFKSVEE